MKINADPSTLASLGNEGVTQNGRSSRAETSATSAAPTASSKIELSATSRNLAAATETSEGGFDAAKVDSIKQAIAAGQLQVNPEAIAHGLITSVTQLLSQSH
jgi:negative regulator of flagellin synthesis FlgM